MDATEQPDEPTPDIDALVDRLRAKVDERRQAGIYPPELEEEMAAHFRRITSHRILPNLDDLQEALGDLQRRLDFRPERTPIESRLPAGAAMHKTLAKLQARQIAGALEQVRDFGEGVLQLLTLITAAIENPNSHVHTDLVGQMDATVERVSGYERAPASSAEAVSDLRRRVEELEALERGRRFEPWFGNRAFADEFRGSRDELLERYADLADHFLERAPVLDIGCGRGEFLQLLADRAIEARGVELDPDLVDECVRRGFKAETGDGLEVLKSVPDGSLGGIVLSQVIEHLTPQQVVDLAVIARDKLRPGGLVMCDTPNPQSLYVYAHSFFLDPTHSQPVHPAYLTFVFKEAGFAVQIDWRSPPPEGDVLRPGEGADDPNVSRLNQLLFAPQEYALLAYRG
ncbi:MAG TPA: methyltransferase domain-containing protein [Acidimicrobiales bacterium]|nr:methyltransferase domain-containing protein [Acidimicrobiales bacterium]